MDTFIASLSLYFIIAEENVYNFYYSLAVKLRLPISCNIKTTIPPIYDTGGAAMKLITRVEIMA